MHNRELLSHRRHRHSYVVEVVGVETPKALNNPLRTLAKLYSARGRSVNGFKIARLNYSRGSQNGVIRTNYAWFGCKGEYAEMSFEAIKNQVAFVAEFCPDVRLRDKATLHKL